MYLKFDPGASEKWPHGYWYAATDDRNHDAAGATPLDATCALVANLERQLEALRPLVPRREA